MLFLPLAFAACTQLNVGTPPDAAPADGCLADAPCAADVASCAAAEVRCGGACVDPRRDPAHCGACDTRCEPAAICAAGACRALTPGRVVATVGDASYLTDPARAQSFAWGANTDGMITLPRDAAPRTRRAALAAGVFDAMGGGRHHACGVAGGEVTCWGFNVVGQTGSPALRSTHGPRVLPGVSGATSVAGATNFSCAIVAEGGVRCWGTAYLGDGRPLRYAAPVAVTALAEATEVSLYDESFACARTSAGEAYCWGYNLAGQIGDGTNVDRVTPTRVRGLGEVRAVSVGKFHACALVADGTVWCWGRAAEGQVGGTPGADQRQPRQVERLAGAVAVRAGTAHTCAVVGDGSVRCWGNNTSGELGAGHVETVEGPAAVRNLDGVVDLSAGRAHTCALRFDGTAFCWGANQAGQLGDGTTTDRAAPVAVVE